MLQGTYHLMIAAEYLQHQLAQQVHACGKVHRRGAQQQAEQLHPVVLFDCVAGRCPDWVHDLHKGCCRCLLAGGGLCLCSYADCAGRQMPMLMLIHVCNWCMVQDHRPLTCPKATVYEY